jgi:hypothetical protein
MGWLREQAKAAAKDAEQAKLTRRLLAGPDAQRDVATKLSGILGLNVDPDAVEATELGHEVTVDDLRFRRVGDSFAIVDERGGTRGPVVDLPSLGRHVADLDRLEEEARKRAGQ